jgi:hypothetical protein
MVSEPFTRLPTTLLLTALINVPDGRFQQICIRLYKKPFAPPWIHRRTGQEDRGCGQTAMNSHQR